MAIIINLDNQHCDASESGGNIGMYVGYQKHPKLYITSSRLGGGPFVKI